MAKFIFRLQSVLNIKEKVEDLKRNEFGKAVSELALAKMEKERLELEKENCLEDFRSSIDTGIEPYAISRYNIYIEKLKKMIIRQQQVVVRAEAFVEEKRIELVEAMRDRKTLETLKENDFEEFLDEEKKAEQKIVDEIVSYRGSKVKKS